MASANRVPFCFSGYDALDIRWGVPVFGLTGFAITVRCAGNLLQLIPQLTLNNRLPDSTGTCPGW